MAATHVDTSGLGHHEAHLHQTLLHVENQVEALIQGLDHPHGQPIPKAHLNGIERQIKDLLGRLREGIRDLELSSEEQDT